MTALRPREKRHIVHTLQDVGIPEKKKPRKPSIPWMRFTNLPLEIIEIIFMYCGQLNYWTYRIFREFERYREYLDPRYLVLTNVSKHQVMYRVPPGQAKEDHIFITLEDFKHHLNQHYEKFKIKDGDLFVFLEFEITGTITEEMLRQIMIHLKGCKIKFSIFLKSLGKVQINSAAIETFVSQDYIEEGDEIIVDKGHLAKFDICSYTASLTFGGGCYPHIKFLEYPDQMKIRDGPSSLFYRLLDLNNVIMKTSIANLQRLDVHRLPNSLFEIDVRIFQNLKVLKLCDEAVGTKRTMFKAMELLNLEELVLSGCQLVKFAENNLPKLKSLTIIERSFQSQKNAPLKLTMIENTLPKLKILNIFVKEIELIHLNKFGEKLESLDFEAVIDEQSVGDVPHIISISEFVVLKAVDDTTLRNMFSNIVHLSKTIKKLLIHDVYSEKLDYLEGKRFKTLEMLTIKGLRRSITELNSLNMPKLKTLTLLRTSIESVKIQNLQSLERLIYTSANRMSRDNDFIIDPSRGLFYRPINYYHHIDLTKVPTKSKPTTVNLNYFKATRYEEKLPQPLEKYILNNNEEYHANESSYLEEYY